MGLIALEAVLEVNGMISVEIGPRRNLVSITRPQCPGVISGIEPERIGVFTQTIEVWILRERGSQSQVLRFEYQGGPRGVEDRLIATLAHNSEGEGFRANDKFDGRFRSKT